MQTKPRLPSDGADAPQLAYDHESPIAYVRQDEYIESKEKTFYNFHDHTPIDTSKSQIEAPDSSQTQQRTVLGLRRRNFWILFIGLIIIVAATIGGSVGGALAVRNSNNKESSSQPQSVASGPTSTLKSSPTASSNSSSPTVSGAPTASTNVLATSTFIVPNPRNVASINVTCPESLKDFTNKEYECTNDITLEGGEPDVTGMIAYNLQQCIDACGTYNELAKNATCVAVVLVSTMARAYDTNHGANCWLKRSGNGPKGAFGNTVARRMI